MFKIKSHLLYSLIMILTIFIFWGYVYTKNDISLFSYYSTLFLPFFSCFLIYKCYLLSENFNKLIITSFFSLSIIQLINLCLYYNYRRLYPNPNITDSFMDTVLVIVLTVIVSLFIFLLFCIPLLLLLKKRAT